MTFFGVGVLIVQLVISLICGFIAAVTRTKQVYDDWHKQLVDYKNPVSARMLVFIVLVSMISIIGEYCWGTLFPQHDATILYLALLIAQIVLSCNAVSKVLQGYKEADRHQ